MSSANLKSNRAGPPSHKSNPESSTEAGQRANAISRTELKSRELKTQPCLILESSMQILRSCGTYFAKFFGGKYSVEATAVAGEDNGFQAIVDAKHCHTAFVHTMFFAPQ